jgi:hypothetical protein
MDESLCNENNLSAAGVTAPAGDAGDEKFRELEKAYGELQKQYDSLQKRNIVEKICTETGCTDPDYLEFCACRRGVDPGDPDALLHFARELAGSSPGCFRARIIPGSDAGNDCRNASVSAGKAEVLTGDRIGLIALSISSAPDAVCR